MAHHYTRLLLILLIAVCLLTPGHALSAEIDDSSLFMDAFNAFQRRDYLFSVEKLNLLNQSFPDSPLRDVSLLMLARAHQRAGEYEAAAHNINQFSAEFGTGNLAGSVDEELLNLGKRQKSGEKLAINKPLHASALKVRNDQLAIERAAVERAERERQARERAERERIAKEKAELERRERERLAAIKAARDAIRLSIERDDAPISVEAAALAKLPFGLVNNGVNTEEFTLSATASTGGETTILANGKSVQKIAIKPKDRIKGAVSFRIPGDRVDGARVSVELKASSVKFTDLIQTQTIVATTSAPLLRAVSRMTKQGILAVGEKTAYRITVLNVGSQASKDVDLRITLPSNLKLVDAGENGCWVESDQVAACRIENVPSGMLTERSLQVVAKSEGQQQRGSVEVTQTVLQVKESFPGAIVTVKKP